MGTSASCDKKSARPRYLFLMKHWIHEHEYNFCIIKFYSVVAMVILEIDWYFYWINNSLNIIILLVFWRYYSCQWNARIVVRLAYLCQGLTVEYLTLTVFKRPLFYTRQQTETYSEHESTDGCLCTCVAASLKTIMSRCVVCRLIRSFQPDFILVRQHARDASDNYKHIILGLHYGGVPAVNSLESVFNFLDRPWVVSERCIDLVES